MFKKALLFFALAAPLVSSPANKEYNWLINGDFNSTAGWNGDLLIGDSAQGKAAFLENKNRAWTALRQNLSFYEPAPPALELSGWMKTQGVKRGAAEWERARLTVVFYDAKNQRLGDWPAPFGQAEGDTDWTFYSNQYSVPKNCAKAEIILLLDNCVGSAWFAGISAIAYDFDQKPLARGEATHPERSAPAPMAGPNWLINPGFEIPGSRDWSNGHPAPGGHDSLRALAVLNATPSWNQPEQVVSFKGEHPVAVLLSGWMKTQGVVRGAENYMTARMGLDFRDSSKAQLGGWQASAAEVVGDTAWTRYEKRYPVPAGSAQVVVHAGLGNCVGKAWFDDMSLSLLDADGKAITTVVSDRQISDTRDWWAYTPPQEASGVALDLSGLNEAPAGKHGFVSIKDGHFAFEDGTRVRFWGSDFVGPSHFPAHAEADLLALRLARLGVNLIRLHMPDASWSESNFFDPQSDNTLSFKPEQVEKFDYMLAALKKNGIYVYPDWIVSRKFRKGDGVPDFESLEDGAKGAVHFDARIIELNKKYATDLLSHVNPYTGLALKDDPIYVANEIVNESSIFSGFEKHQFSEHYWGEMQRQYKAWGGKGEITRFKFDWESQGLKPLKNPENETQSLRFLYERVRLSNAEMKTFQSKLSPHALLAGSNMGLPVLGNIASDASLDYMDTHAYWDHPQIWNVDGGWANQAIAPFNNTSQLFNPFKGSLLFGLSHSAVLGKPLIVTEWNDCFPNQYRIEGPVLMAAYASLQDWDGMLQFAFAPEKAGTRRMNNFDINVRVDNEPLYQLGALIFRRALLKPSQVTVLEPLSDADLFKYGMKSPWLFENPWLPYVAKVAKKFTGASQEAASDLAEAAKGHDAAAKTVTSSTGEQVLDYGRGVLKLESPMVQGFTGAIGAGQALNAGGLAITLDPRNPWASVIALSLSDQPLADSGSILLVAVAAAENSGQVYNATKTALKVPGDTPILMQGVKGDIAIKVSGKAYEVRTLNQDGVEGAPLKSQIKGGMLKFSLSPQDKSSYYRIKAVR